MPVFIEENYTIQIKRENKNIESHGFFKRWFRQPPAFPSPASQAALSDRQQCLNGFWDEKVRLRKIPAMFTCCFSTLFLVLEHWSCRETGLEEYVGGWGKGDPPRKGQAWLSWVAQVSTGMWGCLTVTYFSMDSFASGRRWLVLSIPCEKRWFVNLYYWIIFHFDSRRWPSDQLHKLLVMDWSDMQELLDHSVQQPCPPSFFQPLFCHILHRLLKCLTVPKSHLCSNICFDRHKWQIIPHGYMNWMILPEFVLCS